ncbi:acyl-CoA thioesterase [Synechococcus sp. CCY9202]|nr:acyl-CoA thioesterase [Synechococcus sp. CCY9202]MEA5422372.1 acyl-CoA thioesterase [Synechococcus sp. CCY9202]
MGRQSPLVKTVMQRQLPSSEIETGTAPHRGWCLRRRVLPQHTDHAGVMWHGAYLAWLEEARVEALAAAGLAYRDLAARGLELPVVSLTIDYRQALLHGDSVELWSEVLPRSGVRLPWRSRFLGPAGGLAAEARVELVLVDLSAGPERRRLVRRLPDDLHKAIERLEVGPDQTRG